MVFKYGEKSLEILKHCCPNIQFLCEVAMSYQRYDICLISGHRTNEEQNELKKQGLSQLAGGQSKHNHYPSLAIDMIPSPNIDWNNKELFVRFGEYIIGIANSWEIPIIWGGDWNMDGNLKNQRFFDYVHFETIEKKSALDEQYKNLLKNKT